MMRILILGAFGGALLTGCASMNAGGLPEGLDLGTSADGETCRATRRIDVRLEGLGAQYDVFCGSWRRPAAVIRVYPSESAGQLDAFLDECQPTTEFDVKGGAMSCPGRSSNDMFKDVAIRDEGDGMAAAARGLPALLPVMQRGNAALVGNDAPVELAADELANLPGVAALQDQDVLRRRGHKRNASFRFALAAEDFAKAVSIQDGLFGGDPVRRADIALDLALNLSGQGRFAEAEALFDDTEDALPRLGTPWLNDKLANYRAVHLLNKGQLREALEIAEAPFSDATSSEIEAFAVSGRTDITAISPRDAEFVNQRRGKEVPPLYSDSELRPGVRAAVLKAHRAYVRAVLLELRDDPGAMAVLDEAEALTAAAPPGAAPWLRALIGEKRALIALREGRHGAAVSQLQSIISEWRKSEPRSLLTAQLLSSLGRAQAASGDRAAALASYSEAFDLYSSVEGSFGVSPDRAGEYLALLVDLADGGANAEATARYLEAFEGVVEPRAAAAIAQAAARLGSDSASTEIRAMQDAERALNDAQRALQEEAGAADPERLAELRKAVAEAETALFDAEDVARRSEPAYMQLINRGATPDDLKAVVGAGEAFVAFVATSSGGFGYAVYDGKIVPYQTELNGETTDKHVRRIRLTLRSRLGGPIPFAVEQANEVFEGVFGPIHEDLKSAGVETVVFSPRGALGSLPPAVMVSELPPDGGRMRDRDYREVAWLARDYAFISAPSASSFIATRRTERTAAQGGLTVFGPPEPVQDSEAWVSRLTERMVESGRPERCGRVFMGQENLKATLTPLAPGVARSFNRRTIRGREFTEAAIKSDAKLSEQQVLVFVTHGFFGDGYCITEPSLMTSLGPEGDALLTSTEILDLSLSADLVFLAACDTARASTGAQGIAALFDGAQLDGLVRSFIYAGARAVLATHWVADDRAADILTTQFFAEARGTAMHKALRDAQSALMDREDLAHPYYWGAYVVIGDATHALDARS